MGPPFERHPTTPAQIRAAAAQLSRSEGQLTGVMAALKGPAQDAADAADGMLDGTITGPADMAGQNALETADGARLCKGAVELFADCVELFDRGVDDINQRWENAKQHDFFVEDDVDDRESAIADAQSEEAAALRAEYTELEGLLDTDAENVAKVLNAGPQVGFDLLRAYQGQIDIQLNYLSDPEYVAVGDSYSAGTGTRWYYTDGPDNPYRSHSAYPWLVADELGLRLDHRAVNGATTAGIADQLHTLGPDTKYVTLTAGGNNVGFREAVTDSILGDGSDSITESRRQIDEELPEDLDALYTEIRERAPNATIVVGTYPHLFDGKTDSDLVSDEEEALMNQAADDMAGVIRAEAEEHGFEVADVRDSFDGHESDVQVMLDEHGPVGGEYPDPWINGLTFWWNGVIESFHPNVEGHEAYADEFEDQLR